MARYTYPSEVNWSDPTQLLVYPNTVTDGAFLNWLAIAIYMIIAIGFWFGKKDFAGGIAVAGFSTFIIMGIFWAGGYYGGVWMGIVSVVAVLGFGVLWISRKYDSN